MIIIYLRHCCHIDNTCIQTPVHFTLSLAGEPRYKTYRFTENLDTRLTGLLENLDTRLTGVLENIDAKLTGLLENLDTRPFQN